MRKLFIVTLLVSFSHLAHAEIVIDFESLPVNAGGFYNGDVNAAPVFRENYTIVGEKPGMFGGIDFQQYWTVGGVQFSNVFNDEYGVWSGWSWSNVTDSSTPGFLNQYASFPGGGSNGIGGVADGGTYAVAYGAGHFNLPPDMLLQSMEITNTTYAGLAMQDGDPFFFSKKFGGASGDDPDFFRVVLTGYDEVGGSSGGGNAIGSIHVSLADFTFSDNALDFIVNQWITVDLSTLASARSVGFTFESSDVGPFGINTPTYFAMDNLTMTAVPEPSGLALLTVAGTGVVWWRRRRNQSQALS